jgi:hypothetical protein
MCQRTDIRYITPVNRRVGIQVQAYEVDEDGQPTIEGEFGFIHTHMTADGPFPEYMCHGCNAAFGSWLEAKLHVEDATTEP